MFSLMKRVKFLILLLPAIVFLAILPCVVLAETKTFEVNKDTFANSVYNPPLDYRDNNYGSIGSVVISNKPIDRLGYLQFENIDLPEGAILDQGTFKFYIHEQSYADTAKFNVGPVTGDWAENSLTWNNKPTINQTQAVEAEISLTSSGWKEASITNLVRQWFEGTVENKGLFVYPLGYLYGTAETEYAFSIKTKESGDLAAKLEVEYHLEPSPSPSPEPSPTIEPEETEEEGTIDEEDSSPVEEESPTPSPEPEEEQGLILGRFSSGQAIIAGLILLALIGAGISFISYSRRKPKKEPEKPAKKEKKEEKDPEEEDSEEE